MSSSNSHGFEPASTQSSKSGSRDGNMLDLESQPPYGRSIHAYKVQTPTEDEALIPQSPESAHTKNTGVKSKPIVTIGSSHDRQHHPSISRDDSSTSVASSGVSVEEVKVPQHVRDIAPLNQPGNYKCVVTNFTPVTGSSETVEDENKDVEEETGYALQPLESFPYRIAAKEELDALTDAHPIPEPTGAVWWAKWRFMIASVYRRLCALVITANVAVMLVMIFKTVNKPGSFIYGDAATATGANLLVAALARHEHFVNMLFSLACLLPRATPLTIRRCAAKVYHYGGLHSGCGISALLWYIFYTVLAVQQFNGTNGQHIALSATTAATLLFLTIIVSMAHPSIRKRWHNQWEISHRFGGWTAIALVWAQTLIIAIATAAKTSTSIALTLAKTPTFYFLLLITAMLIYPWLRLRKRPLEAQKLSSHAIRLHFTDRSLPSCVGYRLAHNPLTENHGFATIPNPESTAPGYSIVVSNAGDWTKNLIAHPPTNIWTRGAPTTGVMRIASLFTPIVVVATGSGIGPCLSFLQVFPSHPMRIIWSARFPATTYGPEILRAVLRADRRAVIVDTKVTGHPDLPALAWAMVQREGAEAVVVISNPIVTPKVVFEMERRGVAAFGPVFDS